MAGTACAPKRLPAGSERSRIARSTGYRRPEAHGLAGLGLTSGSDLAGLAPPITGIFDHGELPEKSYGGRWRFRLDGVIHHITK